MIRVLGTLLVIVAGLSPLAAADVSGTAFVRLPQPGGYAVLPDAVTLVISQPKTAQLVYFDTMTDKEVKRVDLDFKPTILVVQGSSLIAANEGSSLVYVLDAMTGKVKKEINAGGDGIVAMSCHPTKGLVYVATGTRKVFAIDPVSGAAAKTDAVGDFILVDPASGEFVYTGIRPPAYEDELIIKTDGEGRVKIIWDRWGARGAIIKYAVKGMALKYTAAQRNAAVNPSSMIITPDGKRIMMTGGGGWRPPAEGGTGGGYFCAVFATDNLDSMVGQSPSGNTIVYHPHLNLAIANQGGRDVMLFAAKSLTERVRIPVAKGADDRPVLFTFVGKGCKVALWNGENPANPEEGLHIIPLDLKDDERAILAKAYGKLPPPPARSATSSSTTGTGTKSTTGGTMTAPKGKDSILPAGVIAEAGFNDAKGINADVTADSPYPLGTSNRIGGKGEPGWDNFWNANGNVEYQKDVVFEGDGAVRMRGTVNFGRKWVEPQSKTFQVEQRVRVPANGGVMCYILPPNNSTDNAGPMWRIENGKFMVFNGDESGSGKWSESVPCKADTWYLVTVTVDTAKKTWEMKIDDKKIEHAGLKFRGRPDSFQAINFLCENANGAYIDAIRIISGEKPKNGKPQLHPQSNTCTASRYMVPK